MGAAVFVLVAASFWGAWNEHYVEWDTSKVETMTLKETHSLILGFQLSFRSSLLLPCGLLLVGASSLRAWRR